MRMRFVFLHILVLMIILVFMSSCNRQQEIIKEDLTVPVKATEIEMQDVQEALHASGTLQSGQISKLSFKIGGIIKKIYIDEADAVKTGQILAELYPDEIDAQLKSAQTQFDKAKRDFERAKNLIKDNAISVQQRQDAESAFDAAKATLQIAEFNSKHARIIAPSSGKVLKIIAEENEMTGAGTPVLVFASTGSAWLVKINMPDKDLVKLSIGDPADIQFDAFPGKIFRAHISEISESADSMTGLYAVELQLDDKLERNINGLVASVDIKPQKKTHCFLLPTRALVSAVGQSGYVYKLDGSNNAVKVSINILGFYNDQLMVTGDLSDGDKIITTGAAYLKEDSKILVTSNAEVGK